MYLFLFAAVQLTCTCGPFECSCRWRPEQPAESYVTAAWSPAEPQYQGYAPPAHPAPPAPALQTQQHYDPTALPADDIFHPEEIFQLDQPIRLDFPLEEHTLESPPTFADLNGENSRPEEAYWMDWQRPAGSSESSQTPSPELFGGYPQTEFCEQGYIPQAYYPEGAQYYPTERTSPLMETQDQRYYRYGQDCAQTNVPDLQSWNYTDCAFTNDMSECKQYFDVQHQAVNGFTGLL